MEVKEEAYKEQIEEMKDWHHNEDISVENVDNGITFDIMVTETKGESSATVRIANYHTSIVLIEKNGQVLFEEKVEGEKEEGKGGERQRWRIDREREKGRKKRKTEEKQAAGSKQKQRDYEGTISLKECKRTTFVNRLPLKEKRTYKSCRPIAKPDISTIRSAFLRR